MTEVFVYIIGTVVFFIFVYYRYLINIKLRYIDILAATSIVLLPCINYFIDVFNTPMYIIIFTVSTISLFILYTKVLKINSSILLVALTLLKYSLYATLLSNIIHKTIFSENLRYFYGIRALSSGSVYRDVFIVAMAILIFMYMDYKFIEERIKYDYVYLNKEYKYSFYALVNYCIDNTIIAIFARILFFHKFSLKNIVFIILYVMLSELSIRNILTKAELIYTNNRLKIVEDQLLVQINHYENYEQYIKKIRNVLHDVNGHKIIINQLIRERKYEEVEKFVYDLKCNIQNYSRNSICENLVLDAIIKNKREVCKVKGICFDYDIDLPKDIRINSVDISIIFNNIINNSIEACDKINNNKIKKYIKMKCKVVDNKLVCSIENSKDNKKIKFDKNFRIETRKKDKFNHGIGIENLKFVIEKYDGIIDFQIDKNLFKVRIIIPL